MDAVAVAETRLVLESEYPEEHVALPLLTDTVPEPPELLVHAKHDIGGVIFEPVL